MINWKVRIKHKTFWLALIPSVLLLVQAILAIFGVQIDFTDLQSKLLAVVDAVFVLLAVLGIVTDLTTEGIKDSERALTYTEPYKRIEERKNEDGEA